MARTVVIDWQRDGLLVAVGARRGSLVAFEQVRLLPLGETEQGTISAGQALRKAIQEMGLSKADAIVIASREVVEIRTLSIPNVDQDELPDIIRFQAQRQMANVGETWPLDYILLPSAGLENKVALAAAISPAHVAEFESAVVGAGLQLNRVLLRPLELARFALNADSSGTMKEGASVVVCLTDSQADLLLLSSGAVVQLRSTRLPTGGEQIANAIVGEIKRSLVAAASQMNGVSLTSAMVIAPADLASTVESAVSQAVGCTVIVVDPVVMLPSSLENAEGLNHSTANRLAAIAGVISAPQPDKRTLIDFKNPKKRPPKEVNFTRYALACATVGLLLLGAGSWWYSTTSRMDRELAELKKTIADKKDLGELALKQIAEFNEIKKALDSSPNWLDEVERIAQNMPDKVLMFSPTMSVAANGEGVIKSKVYAASTEDISSFENMLRKDGQFRVSSAVVALTNSRDDYPWETMITMWFPSRGWDLLGKKPVAAKPVADKSVADKPGVSGPAANGVAKPVAAVPAETANDVAQPDTKSEAKAEVESSQQVAPASEQADEPASDPASEEVGEKTEAATPVEGAPAEGAPAANAPAANAQGASTPEP